jgi:hypothetical protein
LVPSAKDSVSTFDEIDPPFAFVPVGVFRDVMMFVPLASFESAMAAEEEMSALVIRADETKPEALFLSIPGVDSEERVRPLLMLIFPFPNTLTLSSPFVSKTKSCESLVPIVVKTPKLLPSWTKSFVLPPTLTKQLVLVDNLDLVFLQSCMESEEGWHKR